jgi:hypothetical protein
MSSMSYHIYSYEEKRRIVDFIDVASDKKRELLKLGIPRQTYHDWKRADCAVKTGVLSRAA